ncbi:zinc finger protein 414 isoform X2 [Amia ocellicauda]|uniref:zinc finger protein 414 isoform X2 n=1 Tax=Amia ocellicauda TaxID=2972642 RepID=UPI00346449E7
MQTGSEPLYVSRRMSLLQKLLSGPPPVGSTYHDPGLSPAPGMSATPQAHPGPACATEGKLFPCSYLGCKQVFPDIQKLMHHTRIHNIRTQSLQGKLFRCSTLGCTGTFSSMEQLMEHMGNHYKPNRYFVCESCSARLHSHRAFFKHLHICSKVAKNKTPQKLEKVRAVTATEVTECTSKPAVAATSNTAASLSVQSFVREVKKEPAAVPLAPLAPLPPLSGHTAPSAVPALPCSLPSLQASLSSLPLTTLPSNPFSQLQPSMLGAPSMPFTSQTQTEALPTPFLSYMPPTSFSLPQAVVQQQRLRALAPSQPALPVSNAVWKKNQDASRHLTHRWDSPTRSHSISTGEPQASPSTVASSGSTPGGAITACSVSTQPPPAKK